MQRIPFWEAYPPTLEDAQVSADYCSNNADELHLMATGLLNQKGVKTGHKEFDVSLYDMSLEEVILGSFFVSAVCKANGWVL